MSFTCLVVTDRPVASPDGPLGALVGEFMLFLGQGSSSWSRRWSGDPFVMRSVRDSVGSASAAGGVGDPHTLTWS